MLAWSGVACRSGVSCGGVCTVTGHPVIYRPGICTVILHGAGPSTASLSQYLIYVTNTLSTSLGLSGQASGQVAQRGGGRVLHGEQVRDELADQDVPPDHLRAHLPPLDQITHALAA